MKRKLFYLSQSKGYWYGEQHVKDPDTGKVRREFTSLGVKGTDTAARRKAMRALRTLEVQLQMDEPLPAGAMVSVSEFLEQWLEDLKTSNIRPSTHRIYALWTRRFALRLGNIPLRDLQPKHIQEFKKELSKANLKPATINTALRCVRGAFTRAVKQDVIEKHPFRGIKEMDSPARDEEFPAFWTPAQFQAFIDTVPNDRYRLCFSLAFYAGLRLGEVAALRWEDVNGQRLTVTSHDDFRTKTGKSRRVPIAPELAAALAKVPRKDGAVLQKSAVFPDHSTLTKGFMQCRRAYNEAHPEAPLPAITFHGLRHSFATEMATRGIPIPVLQKLLGHSRITTTELYMHVQEDRVLDIAERIMRGEA
jgi:integrase